MPITQQHFFMIRHGETDANANRIMAGSLDSPLTENGRQQAYTVHNVVKNLNVKPKAIIHSHLSRARDTAAIINEALDIPMHEEADLAELHAGDWEGVPYDECPQLLTGWSDPPGGETFKEFMTRIKRAKNRHLKRHDGPVLIVSHGGVFRAFGQLYGLDVAGVIENCHLHEFHPDETRDIFPWEPWQYDYERENVLRRPAENFILTPNPDKVSA